MRRWTAVAAAALVLLGSCALPDSSDDNESSGGEDVTIPGGCEAVDLAVSPEKVDLLTDLAKRFNDSDAAEVGDKCVFVRVARKSSGVAAQLLAQDWPDEQRNGPKPVVWSPASSAWQAVLNQRVGRTMAPPAKPFMLTPLVIAMPRPMATALGYPQKPIGYADILKLAQDPAGWGAFGHPEWGAFKLGKTNPNFSTSALSATIAQYYAATGKSRDLTLEDLAKPEVDTFARGVESSVVHYGDITLTFLNNWFRADARGTALTYVSAVAVEEKSVIDYNRGNPDGVLDPGEKPRPPRVPLVAVYPKEGTLFSDNPLVIVDAPWVNPTQRRGAEAFRDFVLTPANQRRVLEFGFRPGNPSVPVAKPIDASNGVDPNQPQNVLGVPEPPVLVKVLELWGQTRKGARVLVVLDVSGSMGEPATPGGDETKLDLAVRAAANALDQFKADDLVGLRIFSTQINQAEPTDYLDLVPIAPIAQNREGLRTKLQSLIPTQGTPLYTTARAAYEDMVKSFDPKRINAVLLLTDGRNEDPRNDDLNALLRTLRTGSEGQSSAPVRIFPIAYGEDSDLPTLRRVAEATAAAAYDAKDPTTIDQVFTAVVSNF